MPLIYLSLLCMAFASPSYHGTIGLPTIETSNVSVIGLETSEDCHPPWAQNPQTLRQKRKLKSDRLIAYLTDKKKSELHTLLQGYEPVSVGEIEKMMESIEEHWGDLSNSTPVDEKIRMSKGDFDFIYYLNRAITHYGNWYMFSNEGSESHLRIGVTFNKDSDKIGGVVIALVPR